ncbi:DNA-directed RNA polymerase III subunit RPC3 [Linum perenne]
MVPEHGILYAVHLITNHFGNLVAKVCECLLRKGALPLHAIARRTELSNSQVKNSLLVLIQHNCAQAFFLEETVSAEDAGEAGRVYTQYIALFHNILHRVRFSKFLDVVTKELGGACGELLKGLLEHGRLTVKQISDRAEASGKESITTVQENLHKLVMARYVESCPAPEPTVLPQIVDGAKKKAAKSAKLQIIVEKVTLEQRVMSAAMPSEVKRFLFDPNADKTADDAQEVNRSPSKDVGKKRKLGDMDSDMGFAEEAEFMWRANFEELTRRLRHKACVDVAKVRFEDETATVLSAMLEGSRAEEKKVKTSSSVPLSLNSIYEEVVKNEKNHNMTFDHVRNCLHELSSSPAFVKGSAESYSIDFTQIIEAAQSEEVCISLFVHYTVDSLVFTRLRSTIFLILQLESLILKRYGRDAYRMFRLLSKADRLLETDKIADTKLAVGFSAGGYISSSYLLWKVNKKQLLEVVLDEMFHAALNLNIRAAHEMDLNKEVLNLPPEKREGPDKVKFDKLRNARLLIHASLMKIDDAIMLFHDF